MEFSKSLTNLHHIMFVLAVTVASCLVKVLVYVNFAFIIAL